MREELFCASRYNRSPAGATDSSPVIYRRVLTEQQESFRESRRDD